ncbi:hypothetical protein Ancab_039924 [Ancistrocladus abbreviatus]
MEVFRLEFQGLIGVFKEGFLSFAVSLDPCFLLKLPLVSRKRWNSVILLGDCKVIIESVNGTRQPPWHTEEVIYKIRDLSILFSGFRILIYPSCSQCHCT